MNLCSALAAVWKIAWNVNCQPVGDAANTLGYLARYVFKVAISESRILGVDDAQVRFACTKPVNTDSDAPAPKPIVCSHCGGALKLLRALRAATQPPSSMGGSRPEAAVQPSTASSSQDCANWTISL